MLAISKTIKKGFLILIPLILCLTGCDRQSAYRPLLKNPDELKQAVSSCQSHYSQYCLKAYAAQEAVQEFIDVQNQDAQQYPDAAAKIADFYQEAQAAAKDPVLQAKIQAEMGTVNQFYFTVSADYGKRIIEKERQLAILKKQKQSEEQVQQTERVIQAMLALVNVNSGGAE